jgi:hypothetical protein
MYLGVMMKSLLMKRLSGNSFVLFLPFLLLYLAIAALGHRDLMEGDEGRYFSYAQNLLHGYYSPPGEVYLWNGPGYPLVLVPLLAMHLPLIAGTLLNAVFQYLSVVFLFKALNLLVKRKTALLFTLFWACYYVAFKELSLWLTEPLVNLLVCLFLYHGAAALVDKRKNWWSAIFSGLAFGYLVLTKVLLGYVLLLLLVVFACILLFRRTMKLKKVVLLLAVAFLVNLPFLFYTWQLTGRMFYWANIGGMVLYWASTPVEGEFGDWNDDHFTAYCGFDPNMPCNAELFAKNHQADYDSIYQYTGVQRDDAFRKIAIRNIRQHPAKYLRNCIANGGRLFFGFPFSYTYNRVQNVWRVPAGAAVLFLLMFSIVLSLINLKRLPFVIGFFSAVVLLYIGASLAVSAYQRLLTVAVPLIIVWAAYLFERNIDFRWRLPEENEPL